MGMSNISKTKLLQLLFQNDAWELIGDAAGLLPSAAAGNFFVSLHTADPGAGGNQTTNEATYTGYAREAVVRSVAGFTVSGDTVSNAATMQFDECTAGSNTITHFAVGTAASGAGTILYSAPLNSTRTISAGITPIWNIGAMSGIAT
jgi:hypothetical protein